MLRPELIQFIMSMLRFKLLDADIKMPTRNGEDSAGVDLYSPSLIKIDRQSTEVIDLRLKIILPYGTYGQLFGKSSMSTFGLVVNGGVIDRDYEGTFYLLLIFI